MRTIFLFFALNCLIQTAFAERMQFSVNEDWQFKKGESSSEDVFDFEDEAAWDVVNLPHTWNDQDSYDDEVYYYRGPGWYRKQLQITPSMLKQKLYLHFEGANQVAKVYLNGQFVGQHEAGYSAFRFPINTFLNTKDLDDNTVAVMVDNSRDPDISPLIGDWTFFGGIYRDVYLIGTNEIHFDMDDYAADGIYLKTPEVSRESAQLSIEGRIRNDSDQAATIQLLVELFDAEGTRVTSETSERDLKAGTTETIRQIIQLSTPDLWSPSNPYLYTVVCKIVDSDTGKTHDALSLPWGFRWYSFDADDGFKLNGEKMKLIGASRHQDFAHLGNALPDNYGEADVALLKEMGANFLRVAHYPHDKSVLRACDRLGIMTVIEVPVMSKITLSEAFFENARFQMREMIKQYYNHPSVIMWSYLNESLLATKLGKYRAGDSLSDEQRVYLDAITHLAKELEGIARAMDDERYTMMANVRWPDIHYEAKLTTIPKVVGWNLYSGWYGSRFETMTEHLEAFHARQPDTPVFISEFGAGSDPRIRSDEPSRFDFSVEWQNLYNEKYLNAILAYDYVTGGAIWNFADFSSEPRQDAVPYINSKGVTTWDRRPKDSYYYYQARLSDKPVVRVAPRLVTSKIGVVGSEANPTTQQLWIYSNLEAVDVFHNETPLGTFPVKDGVADVDIEFVPGNNRIHASGQDASGTVKSDTQTYRFERIPADLGDYFAGAQRGMAEIRINVGAHYWYTDDSGQVWLKDQAYTPGGFGYIGGEPFTIWGGGRVGSSENIKLTSDDPLYQTQRVGFEAYKFDLPNGVYELTLGLAELLSGDEREDLAFNLGADSNEMVVSPNRIFSVRANGEVIWDSLNLAEQIGEKQATQRKFILTLSDGDGLTLEFIPQKGESILNNVRLKRLD